MTYPIPLCSREWFYQATISSVAPFGLGEGGEFILAPELSEGTEDPLHEGVLLRCVGVDPGVAHPVLPEHPGGIGAHEGASVVALERVALPVLLG